MDAANERLVNDIMLRDRISRAEAERFVILLLEEFRAVVNERHLPRGDFAVDGYRVEARPVSP